MLSDDRMSRRRSATPIDSTESGALLKPEPSDQVRSLLAETQAVSARLAALHEVAAAMQSSLNTSTVLRTLAREARWVLDFQFCSVTELHADTYIEQVLTQPDASAAATRHGTLDDGPIGKAVRAGHALLLHSLVGVGLVPPDMQSALILPLLSRGTVLGTLNFYATQAQHYGYDDLRIAGALAAQAAVVIQNTRLFQEALDARDELHAVLESISDGVFVVSTTQAILLVNQAARQMLGLQQHPLSGRSLAALGLLARANGSRLFTARHLRVLHQLPETEVQGTLQLSDGRHLEWHRTPIQNSSASAGYVISLRDVTARVQLDTLRDDMIAMLVHDLRTPLTTMLLGLDLLNEPSIPLEAHAELHDNIRLGAQQMLRQVNVLLDLRKLEAGRLTLFPEPIHLAALVTNTLGKFKLQATTSKVLLCSEVAENLPFVLLDDELIARVLENLIGNALKFTPAQGQIIVRATRDTRLLTLEVCDSGEGVPAELSERIFEKHMQGAGNNQRKGVGLGLAFCKLVVEAHQGQIGVRTNPGGGSIFWFRIPQPETLG